MQVGRRGVYSEAVVRGGQLIELADENRFAVARDEEWTREHPVEAPQGRRLSEVWRRLGQKRFLVHLIKLLWRELRVRLMRDCAALAPRGVRDNLWRRAGQRLSRLLDHQTRHLLDERSGGAALRRVVHKTGAAEWTRAQADLRDEHPGAGQ